MQYLYLPRWLEFTANSPDSNEENEWLKQAVAEILNSAAYKPLLDDEVPDLDGVSNVIICGDFSRLTIPSSQSGACSTIRRET